MSAAARPELKDARRQFWWGEHDLIDFGVINRIGTSAWAVYTCLLKGWPSLESGFYRPKRA